MNSNKKSKLYDFRKADENISISIHKSHLDNDGQTENATCYGHIKRKVADIRNVIAEMGEKHTGISQSTMYHVASLLKEGMIDFLERGYAINIFDIGIVYIKVKGKISKLMTESKIAEHITLDFTPSKASKNYLKNITVKEVSDYKSPAGINVIKNKWDDKADNNTVYPGKVAEITGTKIKLGNDDSQLYFIKAEKDGTLSKNNNDKIICSHIISNTQSSIMFYVPEELSTEEKYKIVIETNLAISGKTTKTKNIFKSDLITVL